VIANFSEKLFATHDVIKVPVPKNRSKFKIKNSFGRAKYEPKQNAIVWRIKQFPGKAECMLTVDLELVRTVRPKAWVCPPINVEFHTTIEKLRNSPEIHEMTVLIGNL
jgi:AP-2 complex subunit mu-1